MEQRDFSTDGGAALKGILSFEGVESICPWTVRLLNKLGSYQTSIESLYRCQNTSPCVEKAGEQFLYRMSASRDPQVMAMARLELALMRMRQDSTDEYLVEWDRNPELVFRALRSGSELPPAEPGVRYATYISRSIPGWVRCECRFTAKDAEEGRAAT